MTDESSPPREIPYLRLFPWLRLSRGMGVALDPKTLFLAALGLIALSGGWAALDRVFPGSPEVAAPPQLTWGGPGATRIVPDPQSAFWRVSEPFRLVVGPFRAVFSPGSDSAAFLHALLAGVWAAAVWGIIGGALARIAVIQVARSERLGARAALQFALGKWVALIAGPLTPLLGITIFAALCAGYGLLYRLPASFGPVVAGVFLVLPLLAGLVMALIIIGLAFGWPLMHASVAAEDEDGFDALSRSYAYVNQRPAQLAAYVAIAWLLGTIGLVFVEVFAHLVVHLTYWALSFTAPPETLAALFATVPMAAGSTAANIHALWLSAVALVVHAWIFSYFWSSATIIYLLLRQEVDGASWRDVAIAKPQPTPPE